MKEERGFTEEKKRVVESYMGHTSGSFYLGWANVVEENMN
jgi:hypothetical protein